MMFDFLTKRQTKALVREEVVNLIEEVWKECDDIRKILRLLQEEIKIIQDEIRE